MKSKKGTKATDQSMPESKAKAKPEPAERFTRVQALAQVMKAGTTDVDKILAEADKTYAKKTGRESNPKETKWNYGYVKATLLAFGVATEADGKLVLKG